MDKVIESWLSFLGIIIFIEKKNASTYIASNGKRKHLYYISTEQASERVKPSTPCCLLITFKQPDLRQVYKHELVVTHSSITVDEIRTCTCPNLQARSKADSPPLFVLQELQPLSNSTSTCTGNK